MGQENTPKELNVKKRKLQNWWVDPQLQGNILVYFFVPFLLNIVFAASLFYFNYSNFYVILQEQMIKNPDAYKQITAQLTSKITTEMGIFFVSTFLFHLGMGGLLSHKVAGAVYGIKKGIRRIMESKQENEISIRNNDFFQDLVKDINELSSLKKGDKE